VTDIILTADGSSFGRGLPVYHPRRGRQWGIGAILLFIAIVNLLVQGRGFVRWAEGGATPGSHGWYVLLSALGCLVIGISALIGALRGLPRLTVTPTGILLETIFKTQWADWSSLTAFELMTARAGLRRLRWGSAAVVGPAASPNLLRRRRLVLPDAFETPLQGIVAGLNARQARALGAAPAKPLDEAARFGLAGVNTPWLTYVLIFLLSVVFIAEQIFAVGPPASPLSPSLATLVALGGLTRPAVLGAGEWYRLFTAPLLHLDLAHIVLNSIALLMAGFLLERLVGRVWFLAGFVLGGLGGTMASLALNPATIVSVGASGAIMGLFAVALICSFRLPSGSPARWRMQGRAMGVMVPSLLPLAAANDHVDYGAHLGGAVSGALLGLLLLMTWPDGERLPQLRKLAASVASAGLVLVAVSVGAVAAHYPTYARVAVLIPQNELPKTLAEMTARGTLLTQRYPGDPRAHLYRASALVAGRDYVGAERALRLALEQSAGLKLLGVAVENAIRVELVAVLLEEHQRDAAKEAARGPCRSSDETVRQALVNERLCDDTATP
jgi:rhomboid protease GluP